MKQLLKYNLRFLSLALLLSFLVIGCSDDNPANPTADFTFEIDPVNPTKVTFEAMATNGKTLFWDFGDGSYSIAKAVQHTYTTDGDYEVKLLIYGEDLSSPVTTSKTVTIVIPVFEAVAFENGSFELPGDGKHSNWDTVNGWNSDTTASDSGVETAGYATDGSYGAFIKSSDPSVWQLTDHTISANEQFKITLDVYDIWNGPKLTVSLYYDDSGTRTAIGEETFDIAPGSVSSKELIVTATGASVGGKLGIEISNESSDGADGWTGMDNIKLYAK